MKQQLNWLCCRENTKDVFPASVPGNIQHDYAKSHNYGDVSYGENCKQYTWMEDCAWDYTAEFDAVATEGKSIWIVSQGIDYECDIYLNGEHLIHNVGLYQTIEIDITKRLKDNNLLKVHIYPVPKDGRTNNRDEAAQCTKPAVGYGWDWHPRVIPSGIWQETYLETRGDDFITSCEALYDLADDFTSTKVKFNICGAKNPLIRLYNPDNELLYKGTEKEIEVKNPLLWWCNGQGNANLYRYEVSSSENTVCGRIGFRKVELLMNEGAWEEPSTFPKGRSVAPITIRLNNRPIFAKGSNWVVPDIFFGTLTGDRYKELLALVKDANMNILRCWGGAVVGKKEFFDLCDEYGIMVWQEFPLACNNYRGTDEYLTVLEKEAVEIIKKLRSRASHILWCGGNELLNRWSGMTDQSLALRLLNKLCYEMDRNKPYIPTAPIYGMGHGHYLFYDKETNLSVFELYRNLKCTAYSEFGVPSLSDISLLESIIPADELHNPNPNSTWKTHHAFGAWGDEDSENWICTFIIERYFGNLKDTAELSKYSQILQGEGLKFIFEEARRQKPYCSMAMNWCFNEPWITAANQSIISYPAIPKKSYYEVKNALRNVMPSLRMHHFEYEQGETFIGELWMLNDSPDEIETTVEVFLEYDEKEQHIISWKTGKISANTNRKGHIIQFEIPTAESRQLHIFLKTDYGDSRYLFIANRHKVSEKERKLLNQ